MQPNSFQQPVNNYQQHNLQHSVTNQQKGGHVNLNNQPQSQYFSVPFRGHLQSHESIDVYMPEKWEDMVTTVSSSVNM
jgi:hypothetical protein